MRYEYRGHLLAREVNRNGLAFYFEYDGKDESARCVHTWGDGGIYDHKLTLRAPCHRRRELARAQDHLPPSRRPGLEDRGRPGRGDRDRAQRVERDRQGDRCARPGDRERARRARQSARARSPRRQRGRAGLRRPGSTGLPVGSGGSATGSGSTTMPAAWSSASMPLGQTTRFRWAGARLVGVTDPSGAETLLEYDSAGNLAALRTPDGAETHWFYDGLGRCVRRARPRAATPRPASSTCSAAWCACTSPTATCASLPTTARATSCAPRTSSYDVEFKYAGMNRLVVAHAGEAPRCASRTTPRRSSTAIHNEAGAVYRFVLGPTGEVSEEFGFDGIRRKYERDQAGRVQQGAAPRRAVHRIRLRWRGPGDQPQAPGQPWPGPR